MSTKVIVLGGGVAGMSAAHELIERGFEVVVLERRDIAGGKARSIPVVDDGGGTSGHELADSRRGIRSSTGCPASMGSGSSPASTSTSSTPCAAFRRSTGARWRIISCRRRAWASRSTASPRFRVPARFPRTPRRRGHGAARHSPGVRTDHRPHARRSRVLRRAHLADPHLVRASAGSGSTNGRAGGTSSAPSSGRRPTRSSSPSALRARWWPPRRARPARARSATCSCS